MTIIKFKRTDTLSIAVPVEHGGVFKVLTKEQIVYKALISEFNENSVTAKLLLPVGTKVYLTYDKCRADQAKVLKMNKLGKAEEVTVARSTFNPRFKYKTGATIKPQFKFSEENSKCASGIHFFRTLKEARKYLR